MWRNIKALNILTLGGIMVAAMLIGLLVHYYLRPRPPEEYKNLSEIQNYAKDLPEFPAADNNDWLDPHYISHYKQRTAGPLQLVLDKLYFKRVESWSPVYLSKLLKELTQQNRKFGLKHGEKSFIHIKHSKRSAIFVFGDIHGAFHSLIRDLNYLKTIGIINDSLTIIDKEHYIIFNGDAIDRSAYNVDTLILLSILMKKNPHNIFYVAGNHERKSYWLDFALKRELLIRGRRYSQQAVPFMDEIQQFFDTLPEAIYISGQSKEDSVIRIAFNKQNDLHYDESQLNLSFLQQQERVAGYSFSPKTSSSQTLDVFAALKTEDWQKSNRIKHGLGLLDQDQGATTWAVLSSPISVHKVFLDFYDDAFAKITINGDIKQATISRIYRDSRTLLNFQEDPPLNIISAQPPNDHALKTIKIGSTMSLVRGVPTMGQQAERGLNLKVNQYNSISHHHNNIRLYIDNDDYVPIVARSNVKRFIDKGIKYLLLPTGTPTTLSYMDMVKESDVAVLFPITGSRELRDAHFTNLIHFRATYEDEVRALIPTLKNEYGATKFAFFYQDDSYGRVPFFTAVEELKRYGITNFLALPYTRGSISFENQIKALQKIQPDALGFFATATATQEFIRQMGITPIANTQLFAISFVGELSLRRFAKRHGLNFLFGACVPNPRVSPISIAQSYRKAMDEINNNYDVFSFEAFIGTSIFLKAIEHLQGKPLHPKNILFAMEKMKNLDFEGLELDFNPRTRSLARKVWLETGEDTLWKAFPIQ